MGVSEIVRFGIKHLCSSKVVCMSIGGCLLASGITKTIIKFTDSVKTFANWCFMLNLRPSQMLAMTGPFVWKLWPMYQEGFFSKLHPDTCHFRV